MFRPEPLTDPAQIWMPDTAHKNRDRSKPSFGNINLLGPCNLGCRWCLGRDLAGEFDRFNDLKTHFNEWKNFDDYLSKLEAAGIDKVYLTGQNTDPLLYRHLSELVAYLKGRGFFVGIRTNGVAAKDEKIDILNEFDSVSLTMLSQDPETYYKITGRRKAPNWDEIIRAITTRFRIAVVIDRYNVGELRQIISFLSQYEQVKYLQVRKTATDTRYGLLKEDMDVFEKMYREILAEFPQIDEFESAPIHEIDTLRVTFWKTVATTVNSHNYWTNGVMSADYFVIEGYLRNRFMSLVGTSHQVSRTAQPDGYPKREPIPDEKVLWDKPYPEYAPSYYVSPTVLANDETKVDGAWAHSDDIDRVKLPEKSHEGLLLKDRAGYPLNPRGRTGILGRGDLGKWGPNFAVDPVITRFNPETGQFEMLTVQREDSDKWAIPGIILLDGEDVQAAMKRRLSEKIGVCIGQIDHSISLYKGYVDDPRNTDNAWLETNVLHVHLPYEETDELKSNLSGDEPWGKWLPMTVDTMESLYANHGEFASLALQRLNPEAEYENDESQEIMLQRFKDSLNNEKEAVIVCDVHGTLLEDTWVEEFRDVFLHLMGKSPSVTWMSQNVIGKLNPEVIRALCEVSDRSEKDVREILKEVRERHRKRTDLKIRPGALDFIKAAKEAGIKIVINTKAQDHIVIEQLKAAGFLEYLDMENIFGGDPSASYSRATSIDDIQARFPNACLVNFDDWYEGISAVQKNGGVAVGLPQGRGQEFAAHRERLAENNVDIILNGWNQWREVLAIIIKHNEP